LFRISKSFFLESRQSRTEKLGGEEIRTNTLRIRSFCTAGERVSQVVIENPIINSPFDEPIRHFRFNDDGITAEEVAGRTASFKKAHRNGRGMKLLELCIFALSLVLTANSQADTTVKSYLRKNGTEVSGYDRRSDGSVSNGTSNAPTPASQPVQVYTSQEAPVNTIPPVYGLSPAEVLDNEIAARFPASTDVTSEITSNEWRSDTLVVHGTLTNTSSGSVYLRTPALVGYDAKSQEISAGKIILANPELKAGQKEPFTAEISDPQKAIKFTKLVGIRSSYYFATEPSRAAPTPYSRATPYATASPRWHSSATPIQVVVSAPSSQTAASGSSFGGIIVFAILGVVGVCIVKFSTGLGSAIQSPAATPTSSDSLNQQETLDDLRKGITPDRYNLSGFVCKKNEKVLFSFQGVRHFHQGTHSQWTGRSAGVSVKVVKGLWFRTGANRGHSVSSTSMDDQGTGTLVLTNLGFSFIGTNSTRIPFSHILSLEPYVDGFGLDTDYARNNKHVFGHMHPTNAAFVKSAVDIIGKS
jgi:hypothetical protein